MAMDQQSTPIQTSVPSLEAVAALTHPRDRRREKPLLSCTFCRRRKIRCDRQFPCKTCVSKGIGLSCSYEPGRQRKGTPASVGERIQELESLVRSLLQQQQHQETQIPVVSSSRQDTGLINNPHGGELIETPESVSTVITALTSPEDHMEQPIVSPISNTSLPSSQPSTSSPCGRIRVNSRGTNYVSSVHWAAVLDSISELKDHYKTEDEARRQIASEYPLDNRPYPRLLYEPVQVTKVNIIASIPGRPVVDRIVARYFNAQGVAPAVVHSGQFLREYESFWEDPSHVADGTSNADNMMRIHMFRERTVNCLILGKYTAGGPYVLETLIDHCATEMLLCKDADIELWLLLGTLVQLALSHGFHRDPDNFQNISPFAGEMRRRVWAVVVQMDLRLSSLIGQPRLLKAYQSDTLEPRNLLDSDFNEETDRLP